MVKVASTWRVKHTAADAETPTVYGCKFIRTTWRCWSTSETSLALARASTRSSGQHTRQVYQIILDGQEAMDVIALLTPHLNRKKPEALAGRTYWTEGQAGKHFGPNGMPPEIRAIRDRLYLEMRSLK